MFSISDLFLKMSINRYIRKLNNKMLEQLYINESKKNPKTHVDNVYIQCLLKEMKNRRGEI